MEALFVTSETELKRWVKEALQEYFQQNYFPSSKSTDDKNEFINRKDVALLLNVSLVTLTDWMKRGLPFYKQRGRVYFVKAEVLDYIQKGGRYKDKLFTDSPLPQSVPLEN